MLFSLVAIANATFDVDATSASFASNRARDQCHHRDSRAKHQRHVVVVFGKALAKK